MGQPKTLTLAATAVMLVILWLLVGCAGRGGSYGGRQGGKSDDVSGKSEIPQGTEGKIAFESVRHGNNTDIYTMNADGTGLLNLTEDNPDFVWFPAWSPDGRKIAYSGIHHGDFEIY